MIDFSPFSSKSAQKEAHYTERLIFDIGGIEKIKPKTGKKEDTYGQFAYLMPIGVPEGLNLTS